MSQIGPQSVLARNETLVTAPMGEELVMMDVDAGSYFALDGVASSIWSALEQPRTMQELLDALTARYDVAPERCAADVVPFLERMAERRLLQIRDAS